MVRRAGRPKYILLSNPEIMHSKKIQEEHRDVYEKFFAENQWVISAPFVMNWSGDVLNNYIGVSIKQKIPLRIYMGYTRNTSGKIRLKTIQYLDINEDRFIEANTLEYAPYFTDLQKEIQKTYNHLLENYWGIDVYILSELPRWVGLWFGSLITLLLATLFEWLSGSITSRDIQELPQQTINNSLADPYNGFSKIFLQSCELDKHMYGMISSGTKFAAFFDTHYPVASFCEDFDKNSPHVQVQEKRFFGFALNDLYKSLKKIPYSPIDYWLIYSGKPVLLEQIAGKQYKSNTLSAMEIKKEFRDLFGDYLQHLSPHQRPRFYKHLIAPETDEFDLIYGKMMWIISLKILYFMVKMYGDGYDEFNMLQLLDSVKKRREADCVTRDSSSAFLNILKAFLANFQWSNKYFAICPNDSSIMWWTIMFASPLEWFRRTVQESISKSAQQFDGIKLLYENRSDGIESTGIKIEQDISWGIYNDVLSRSNCVLRRANGKVLIGDCEESIESHTTGLLLDTLHNKIYLNGEKLTSQDIHSQTATIEIMKLLIRHLWQEIINKQLPASTYSKNKNEMVSKIVFPLIDLVEKKTGKKIHLICKGSLYDFYLKLNPSDVDIAIVTRISEESI